MAILGLAYKPDTDVAENSPGVAVAQLLSDAGLRVRVYDPAALDNARRDLADTVEYADSMLSCIRGASAIVITTPWAEFKLFDADVLADAETRPTVVDCWRILDRDRMTKVAEYVVVGAGRRVPRSGSERTPTPSAGRYFHRRGSVAKMPASETERLLSEPEEPSSNSLSVP